MMGNHCVGTTAAARCRLHASSGYIAGPINGDGDGYDEIGRLLLLPAIPNIQPEPMDERRKSMEERWAEIRQARELYIAGGLDCSLLL